MGRAPCCEKEGLNKGRWTAEEDEILLKYIAEHGEGAWRSLPKNAGLLRCGKSCRLRWINYLRADLKRGNISNEEEQVIIKLHASLGNRWSVIAAQLPGRTDNEIKNYWNSHLSRRIHSFRRLAGGETIIVDLGNVPGGGKRRFGRTSLTKMNKSSPSPGATSQRKEHQRDGHATQKTMTHGHSNLSLGSSSTSAETEKEGSSTITFNCLEFVLEDLLGPTVERSGEEEEMKMGEAVEEEGKAKGKGPTEMEEMVDWDLEGLEEKMWEVETSEMWASWLWEMGGVSGGCEEDLFCSWLLA
ncbi:hypothetical protein HPP92_000994 [Vanilla planifolia]|uniref:Uncharacterized protein n=1 Tax=Vanilla planifolia TaxID=51239 RepID=A0A835SB54_VANPL|nr:hypothetical protein HPP92_001162 [Vanilla planifolia]KAG0500922.1 hypothetical protein HPP92_000994 [Vanilla planifolia]